jgi:hypothetical protein
MHELNDAIFSLIAELKSDRDQRRIEFEWWKAHSILATKQDLQNTERRILDAIAGVGGKDLSKLTNELKASADPLIAALAEQKKT